MTEYELLYVVAGDESEESSTKVTDQVNAVLLKAGGKVNQEDTWGRKRLAYEIDKQNFGWFVATRFSVETDQTAELQNQLRLNGKLIRTMLVRADELPNAEDAARAEEAVQSSGRDTRKPGGRPEKPAAKPTETEAAEPKKPETAAEKKERQSKLDAKLGEILKEEA